MARISINQKFKRVIEECAIMDFLADHGHEPVRQEGSEQLYLCPFHADTTPSFKVNPEKRCFNCFGCNAGQGLGQDIIGLAILIYQIDAGNRSDSRTEACKRLWHDYFTDHDGEEGREQAVAKPRAQSKSKTSRAKKKKEPEVINPPSWVFKNTSDEQASEYLNTRGITEATQKRFGLTVPLKGTSAGKLAIPLRDIKGNLIGYALRTMDESEPKYIFPPKEKGFRKSHFLYNLDALEIAWDYKVILVEGFFDVFHLYQHGIWNVVAVMGSTLSDQQADLIPEWFDFVTVFFDGDEAGERGAKAAREKLRERGIMVKRVVCPDGKQPEDLNRDELTTLLSRSSVAEVLEDLPLETQIDIIGGAAMMP